MHEKDVSLVLNASRRSSRGLQFVAALLIGAATIYLCSFALREPVLRAQDSRGKTPVKTKKRLAPLRVSEDASGTHVSITADAPISDYSTSRSGNYYYLVIPHADASALKSDVRGRGVTSVQAIQRGDDAILTVQLQPGASAFLSPRFNRLDLIVNPPGAKNAGAPPPISPNAARSAQPAQTAVAPTPQTVRNESNNATRATNSRATRRLDGQLNSSQMAETPVASRRQATASKATPTPSVTGGASNQTPQTAPSVEPTPQAEATPNATQAGGASNETTANANARASGTTSNANEIIVAPARGEDDSILNFLKRGWRFIVGALVLLALLLLAARSSRAKEPKAYVGRDYRKDVKAMPRKDSTVEAQRVNEAQRVADVPASEAQAAASPQLSNVASLPLVAAAAVAHDESTVQSRAAVEDAASQKKEFMPHQEQDAPVLEGFYETSAPPQEFNDVSAQSAQRAGSEDLSEFGSWQTVGLEGDDEAIPIFAVPRLPVAAQSGNGLRENPRAAAWEANARDEEPQPSHAETASASASQMDAAEDQPQNAVEVAPQRAPEEVEPQKAVELAHAFNDDAEYDDALLTVAQPASSSIGTLTQERSESEVGEAPSAKSAEESLPYANRAEEIKRKLKAARERGATAASASGVASEAAEATIVGATMAAAAGASSSSNAVAAQSSKDAPNDASPPSPGAPESPNETASRIAQLEKLAEQRSDSSFKEICAAFDDSSDEVRGAAARALFAQSGRRAEIFTRALREATPERRQRIGESIASSGFAEESVNRLAGEGRETTYESFSLLYLMAKAGEIEPLLHAVESHASEEIQLSALKILSLSGNRDALSELRRLAVRSSLPISVRSAVMDAVYQLGGASQAA